MERIRKGDNVIVISGKDKGKTGIIQSIVSNTTVLVEGLNFVKKHIKPNPNTNEKGGIVDKEMPLNKSNIMLLNKQTNTGGRIGFKILQDGRKVRYFKSNSEVID